MSVGKDTLESALIEFIDNAPVGIFRTQKNGQIVLANSAFVRMLQYPSVESLREVNAAKLCADSRDSAVWMRELNRHGIVQHFETRLGRHDGSSLWVELHGRAIKDEQGNLAYFEGVSIDISHRKAAEAVLIKLTSDLQESFDQTISSLSRMMEKRDPYTAIHQRRVAHLASAIASEIGLPEMGVRGVYFGGLIHDIGKFFIPLEFLCCTGPLGAPEMELIRRHTCNGFEIVKNIASSWPIAEIVQQHHERLNGTGYPFGLGRRDILVEARIVAVADTVEAMAGHRPYRPSLGVASALAEIEKCSDEKYDTDIVNACLRLFNEKNYQVQDDGGLAG